MAAVALAVRLVGGAHDLSIMNDGPRFLAGAQAWLRGDLAAVIQDDFHPGTGALIAAIGWLTGMELEAAGRALSAVCGTLAAVALFGLARDALSERVALVAGLFLAVHPPSVLAASSVQSDGLHQMLVIAGAWALWRALLRSSPLAACAAGALCGLAYLVRPEGLILALVMGLWVGASLATRSLGALRAATLSGAFALALAATAGPYVTAVRAHTGEWTLTQKKSLAGMLSLDGALAHEVDERLATSAPRLTNAPVEVAFDGLRAIHPLFFALCLLGLPRRWPPRAELYLLSYPAALGVVLLLLRLNNPYVSRRHWLVGAALLLPFAARGVLWLADALPRLLPRIAPRPRAVYAGLVVAIATTGLLYTALDRENPEKLARVEAARWLRDHAPGSVLAALRSRTAWYAGASRFVELARDTGGQQAIDAARADGAEYVISEESGLPLPQGEELRGVERVHEIPYPGGRVLVLRLAPTDVAAPPPPR